MHVSKTEAQQSLETIQQIQQDVRRSLASGGAPLYMMLWGVIWFIGFLGSYVLAPQTAGTLWTVLVLAGFVLSFVIGGRTATKIRMPGYGARIGTLWLMLALYTAIIIWIGNLAHDEVLLSLIISILAMFGYVVMGLWFDSRPLIGIGLGITAIIILAYVFLPEYINLAMAFLGGGALFLAGLYIHHSWR